MPPESNYICKPGDKVAAIVKSSNSASNPNSNTGIEEESEEENWILAEVYSMFLNFRARQAHDPPIIWHKKV